MLPLTFFCLINFLCGQSARAEILFDNSYAPTLTRLNDGPASILLLPDEKILAIRLANQNILGTQEYKVTCFNSDGSTDRIFDSAVMDHGNGSLLLQTDGKILVLGSNIFVNGENRGGIVRLNADGTFDTSFNTSWALEAIGGVIQPDGRILVGVASTNEQVLNRLHKVTRLNSDGSLDLTFSNNANGIPLSSNPSGIPLALQPDGKILISKGSGNFE